MDSLDFSTFSLLLHSLRCRYCDYFRDYSSCYSNHSERRSKIKFANTMKNNRMMKHSRNIFLDRRSIVLNLSYSLADYFILSIPISWFEWRDNQYNFRHFYLCSHYLHYFVLRSLYNWGLNEIPSREVELIQKHFQRNSFGSSIIWTSIMYLSLLLKLLPLQLSNVHDFDLIPQGYHSELEMQIILKFDCRSSSFVELCRERSRSFLSSIQEITG